jgi:hypothetical protein
MKLYLTNRIYIIIICAGAASRLWPAQPLLPPLPQLLFLLLRGDRRQGVRAPLPTVYEHTYTRTTQHNTIKKTRQTIMHSSCRVVVEAEQQ